MGFHVFGRYLSTVGNTGKLERQLCEEKVKSQTKETVYYNVSFPDHINSIIYSVMMVYATQHDRAYSKTNAITDMWQVLEVTVGKYPRLDQREWKRGNI